MAIFLKFINSYVCLKTTVLIVQIHSNTSVVGKQGNAPLVYQNVWRARNADMHRMQSHAARAFSRFHTNMKKKHQEWPKFMMETGI